MNDLISRQAAITIPVTPKEDREYQTFNLDDAYEQAWDDLQKRIEQLPSAQPDYDLSGYSDRLWKAAYERGKAEAQRTGRWIPVSERLPKPGKEVFVYLWGDVPYLASMNDKGQWETDHFYLDADEAPKAWMSLPEPYKEGK